MRAFLESKDAKRGQARVADGQAELCDAAAKGDLVQLNALIEQGLPVNMGELRVRVRVRVRVGVRLSSSSWARIRIGVSLSSSARLSGQPVCVSRPRRGCHHPA